MASRSSSRDVDARLQRAAAFAPSILEDVRGPDALEGTTSTDAEASHAATTKAGTPCAETDDRVADAIARAHRTLAMELPSRGLLETPSLNRRIDAALRATINAESIAEIATHLHRDGRSGPVIATQPDARSIRIELADERAGPTVTILADEDGRSVGIRADDTHPIWIGARRHAARGAA